MERGFWYGVLVAIALYAFMLLVIYAGHWAGAY